MPQIIAILGSFTVIFKELALFSDHNVFMSFTIDLVGLPSCIACHSVNIVYPGHIGWWLLQSLLDVPSLVRSAKSDHWLLFSCRRLPFRNLPFDFAIISPSSWTFSFFSFVLHWLANVAKVSLVEHWFLKGSLLDFVKTSNLFMPYELIFKTNIFCSSLTFQQCRLCLWLWPSLCCCTIIIVSDKCNGYYVCIEFFRSSCYICRSSTRAVEKIKGEK